MITRSTGMRSRSCWSTIGGREQRSPQARGRGCAAPLSCLAFSSGGARFQVAGHQRHRGHRCVLSSLPRSRRRCGLRIRSTARCDGSAARGAKLFISKEVDTDVMADAIRRTLAGDETSERQWITRPNAAGVLKADEHSPLTPRQLEILSLLHLPNKEIGLRLGRRNDRQTCTCRRCFACSAWPIALRRCRRRAVCPWVSGRGRLLGAGLWLCTARDGPHSALMTSWSSCSRSGLCSTASPAGSNASNLIRVGVTRDEQRRDVRIELVANRIHHGHAVSSSLRR